MLDDIIQSDEISWVNCKIKLLVNIAKINADISNGRVPNIDNLANLAKLAIDNNLEDILSAQIFNALTVSNSRYRASDDPHDQFLNDILQIAGKKLYEYLNTWDNFQKKNGNSLIISSLWRGLAMWDQLDEAEQENCLNKAIFFSDIPDQDNQQVRTVVDENKVTLKLTLTKFFQNNEARKIRYLTEITDLDPCDSTAYTELGLHFLKKQNYSESLSYFLKAAELGPPGLGMNTYFAAQCYFELGNLDATIIFCIKNIKIDPFSISPYLLLIKAFEKNQNREKILEIVRKVLENSDLSNQLSTDEIFSFNQYLK